jgi:hypothetical protein
MQKSAVHLVVIIKLSNNLLSSTHWPDIVGVVDGGLTVGAHLGVSCFRNISSYTKPTFIRLFYNRMDFGVKG